MFFGSLEHNWVAYLLIVINWKVIGSNPKYTSTWREMEIEKREMIDKIDDEIGKEKRDRKRKWVEMGWKSNLGVNLS